MNSHAMVISFMVSELGLQELTTEKWVYERTAALTDMGMNRPAIKSQIFRDKQVHVLPVHDDFMEWKPFSRYWPFVFTGHRWISRTKVSDAEPWCFLWFAPE